MSEPKETTAARLQKTIQEAMYLMDEYKDLPEYKTIMMNLTTVSKSLNTIRLKEIYPEANGS